MHRIAATPGGWNPHTEGVIFLEQSPAPIVILTAADTDIQTLSAVVRNLDAQFPKIRVANLLHLQQELTIDTYAETVLAHAKVIILRLLGGRAYWSYGLEVVKETVATTGAALFAIPGEDRPDPDLMGHSTLSLSAVNRLWRYFTEGGTENYLHALQFVCDLSLGSSYNPPPAKVVPRVGLCLERSLPQPIARVGILFYRAHYLAGNTKAIAAVGKALAQRNLEPVSIFVSSLSDSEVQEEVLAYLRPESDRGISLLLNTTSFSLAKLGEEEQTTFWKQLDIPVIQAILAGTTVEQWQQGTQGLSPRDVAMNVALPEVDGRIISTAISFKSVAVWDAALETDVVSYEPVSDRVAFVADLAVNWVNLANLAAQERKVAIILANYPNRDGRLANGVGLDTPASCVALLLALQQAGYTLDNIPATGDELIDRLTSGMTNDPERWELRSPENVLSLASYREYFATLPQEVQTGLCDAFSFPETDIAIPGFCLGNIFLGIQPSRGYDRDPSLNYHSPDLEPTHEYLAFYHWLRQEFGANGVIHVGKHGNLEWLPGKSIALSRHCYPEVALSSLPHFYPFIVNDPGEGSQAKRRSHAVILDHLTPPLTRAELYGSLQQLEALIDEYYEAQSLHPRRLTSIKTRIVSLVKQENLHRDLGMEGFDEGAIAEFLNVADGYLCELKEAQIRDGLHIFGSCPQGRQLRDLVVAIARSPSPGRMGLTRAIARDGGYDFDPLTEVAAHGDAVEEIELLASELVEYLITAGGFPSVPLDREGAKTRHELDWIREVLLPRLRQCDREIGNLLRALAGKYVESGAAGAPTRGRPEVLPTGRNFYSVDIRAIPTETAWDVGRKAAEALVDRYTQEHGEYPQTLAISVWGTSTMRTGGDDLAQALALLGVRPVWDGLSRRVVDFEILPIESLGRPRVDVTLRVSGFFRDGFPNLIHLFNEAVEAIARLDESRENNPLAAKFQEETIFWQQQGLNLEAAEARSQYRVYGSKPGAYGAGLQGLIEAQNWQTDEDLARAYINWSSYAYTSTQGQLKGTAAPEAFSQRLRSLQVVLHNQDNREHDLLDSDDYYQFQGGLTAAVRSLSGQNPQTYFGDNSLPFHPRVRQLREEIARVYRSRVVNPKWLEGVMRHGYKGAFEMSATVDYLFAYDATARCVEDFMYQGIADAYLLDETVQKFVRQKNPWALRDMAERLLEAHQRGLWGSANETTLEDLRALVNSAEGAIEEKG